jgi:uncharacterized protein (DUF2336 family)
MAAHHSLISEIEDAIGHGSDARRLETLRRVTNLFLLGVDQYTEEQIGVFDDVLGHLIDRIETTARAELGERLAAVDKAPIEVVRRLAGDDEIAVAGPVLSQSARLTQADLVNLAKTKSQEHLLAISGRTRLDAAITDVLVDRGNSDVAHKVVTNAGAEFSTAGFEKLVKRAETDERLTEHVARRHDVPPQLFKVLIQRASDAVQKRIMVSADPVTKARLTSVITEVSTRVEHEAKPMRDYSAALDMVRERQQSGRLREHDLVYYAKTERFEEAVAALSLFCQVPVDVIDHLLHNDRPDAFLIPCKAADLDWPTVHALLRLHPASARTAIEALADDYLKLTKATADRVMRFWRVRKAATSSTAEPALTKH